MTYLTKTAYGGLKYERRVPSQLKHLIPTKYIRISLGKDEAYAIYRATQINEAIDKALVLVNAKIDVQIVCNLLEPYFGLKNNVATESLYEKLVDDYVSLSVENTKELHNKERVFTDIFPILFEAVVGTSNPDLAKIKYKDILRFRELILKLPKRNIRYFGSLDLRQVINGTINIEPTQLLKPKTINKYMSYLKGLYRFSIKTGALTVNMAELVAPIKLNNARVQRLAFEPYEADYMEELLPEDKRYLVQILRFSGMRLSELYKCKISTINNVKCFDLTSQDLDLKTVSSYRLIPIHNRLLYNIEGFNRYRAMNTAKTLSEYYINKLRSTDIQDSDKKVLYSLRHSFATQLIKLGAVEGMVSELMGHSHKSMTLSRYAKGYDIRQLSEVIHLL